MLNLDFALTLQLSYTLVGLGILIFGFLLGTKYAPHDDFMPRVLFVIGLVASVLATFALAKQAPYIVGYGLLSGAFLMGIGMGMQSRQRP